MRDPLDWAIILEPGEDGGSLHGEPTELLREAVDAGILYACTVEDGSCGIEHRGGPFMHFCEGKTTEDYDRFAGVL